MPFTKRPQLLYKGRGQFVVFRPGIYIEPVDGAVPVIIKSGYRTDLATRPRILRWFMDSFGVYEDCAIVHDINCDEQKQAVLEGRKPRISSRDTDKLFRTMMCEEGVTLVLRWLMWTAVRWGAVASRYRRKGVAPDLFKMVVISLLASPVIVPVTLISGLGMAIYWLVERAFGLFVRS